MGALLRELARLVSKSSKSRSETKAFEEAAESLIQLMNAVVRMQLRAAFEPEAFSIYYPLRDWFEKGSWDSFLERDIVSQSRRDISDSIEILARSGRADKQLTLTLRLISTSEDRYQEMIERIMSRNEGLTPEIIAWLRDAPIVEQSAHSEANEILRLENLIGRLMLTLTDIQTKNPGSQNPELTQFISALASERRLQLFGNVGTVVQYSSLEHEAASPDVVGLRDVVVKRSGIVGRTTDGRRRIVVRSLVDRF